MVDGGVVRDRQSGLPGNRPGPQHHAAHHTGTSAHTGPFCPQTAGDSRPRRAWPSHRRGRPTEPDASTDSHPENSLVKPPSWGLWPMGLHDSDKSG